MKQRFIQQVTISFFTNMTSPPEPKNTNHSLTCSLPLSDFIIIVFFPLFYCFLCVCFCVCFLLLLFSLWLLLSINDTVLAVSKYKFKVLSTCFSNNLYVVVLIFFSFTGLLLVPYVLGLYSSYCILFKCQRVCAAVCKKLN